MRQERKMWKARMDYAEGEQESHPKGQKIQYHYYQQTTLSHSGYRNCQQVHDGRQAPWADGLPDTTSGNEPQPRRRARPALQDYMTFPMVHKKADDDTFDLPLL